MASYDELSALLKNQNWQSMDANTLAGLLSSQNPDAYSGKTEDEIRQQAVNKYSSIYNTKKLAAQQAYETTEKSITDQLSALGQTYAKQAESTQSAVNKAISSVSNSALSRGLGRSSYTTASMGDVQKQGVKALSELLQSEAQQRSALSGNLALAKQQLAQQLAAYDTNMETDVQAEMDTIRENDYVKQLEALNMQNQLVQWLAEYAAAHKKSSSGYYPQETKNPTTNDGNTNGAKDNKTVSPMYRPVSELQKIIAGRAATGSTDAHTVASFLNLPPLPSTTGKYVAPTYSNIKNKNNKITQFLFKD